MIESRRLGLTASEAALLRHVAVWDAGHGLAVRQRDLAKDLCMSRNTVTAATNALCTHGVLLVERPASRRTAIYRYRPSWDGARGSASEPPDPDDGARGSASEPPDPDDGARGSASEPPRYSLSLINSFIPNLTGYSPAAVTMLATEFRAYVAHLFDTTGKPVFAHDSAIQAYFNKWFGNPDAAKRCRLAPGRPVPTLIKRLQNPTPPPRQLPHTGSPDFTMLDHGDTTCNHRIAHLAPRYEDGVTVHEYACVRCSHRYEQRYQHSQTAVQ